MLTLSLISRTTRLPQPAARLRQSLAALALLAAALCAPGARAQTASLPVIVADFNHDGIPDVLVPSNNGPSATIAFGSTPYGTFSNPKGVTFPAACSGSFPNLSIGQVLIADFKSGDSTDIGFPDIFFFCGSSAGVMTGDGDGTFTSPALLTGFTSVSAAVTGDFNHDGKPDLALIGSPDGGQTTGILFYAGNGDGTFASPVYSAFGTSPDFTPLQAYTGLASADLNGDGYPDLLINAQNADSSQNILVFGNNQDGTFGSRTQNTSLPHAAIPLGSTPTISTSSILTGNVFGTSNADVVLGNVGSSPGVLVLKNTSTSTTYSLASPTAIPYAGFSGVQVGSFTGSGFSDLAVANGTSISVYNNDGSGNFTATYATLSVPSASGLFAVADANGDGYADIYTASSQSGALQLAVNLTTGTATATSQPVSLSSGSKAISAAWVGNINFAGATANGTQTVTGTSSAVTLTSSRNPSMAGDSVTLTVQVAPAASNTRIPTGTVVLNDGTSMLVSGTLDGTGTYTYTTSALTPGPHTIQASYSGDGYYASSASQPLAQVVTAVTPTLTWAPPSPIVFGTPLGAMQLNAAATGPTGSSIPGTYTYTPPANTVLSAGTQALRVVFTPTDSNSFQAVTGSTSLLVQKAVPQLTWSTPSPVPAGSTLSAAQLNASAIGVTGAALPGTFTYTPSAGSLVAAGTQTLSVLFTPTDSANYITASASVQLLGNVLSLTALSSTTAMLGDPAKTLTLTGTGFLPSSIVQVNGAAVGTTYISPTALSAIIPAASFQTVQVLQITVSNPTLSQVSQPLTVSVTAPPLTVVFSGPGSAPPATQPTATLQLTNPYPVPLAGTLTLSFAPTSGGPNDPAIQFAQGGRSLAFTIPANSTSTPTIQFQAGTVAGAINLTLDLKAGGADVTPTTVQPIIIQIPAATPAITSATFTQSGNTVTVVVVGYSNTVQVSEANFHFTAAAGSTVTNPDVMVPVTPIFSTWYSSSGSPQYGSQFTYTQSFNLSESATIQQVSVTLVNSVGTSASASTP